MEGENNREAVKIDIHVSDKGKAKRIVQDGEREYLLEGMNKAESWIDQVKRRHRSGKHKEGKSSPVVSIYRVPEFIKKTKREAYDPVVVCLGPYHHEEHQQLTAMDNYKLQAVDRILERIPGMTIEGLVAEVRELEKEIRDCYEDSAIEWDGDTLAWMMTMDACFILEFLQMNMPNSSLIFHSERHWNIKRKEILLDILKLENQIPFFILKKILELVKPPEALPCFLAQQLFNIGWYFRGYPFSLANEVVMSKLRDLIEGGPHHLLDLSRQTIVDFLSNSFPGSESADFLSNSGCGSESVIPNKCCARFRGACWTAVSRWLLPSSVVSESLIPSAEKLQRAGIKLKANTEGKFHFQRRYFRHSTLLVPQIFVEDYTEIFLRNLVAFEECEKRQGSPIKRVISSNMWIMDQLIDSKEDVKLFQRADIIKNYLGTEDEVAKIFNDLCVGITSVREIGPFSEVVNKHYKSRLNVLISEFRKEHCSRPWYIVSILAAVLLLVMTLLQTIYTMKGYFRSNS